MAVALSALAEALQGRYTFERELGRGGMATVYLARDLRHDRLVALKVLHPDLAETLGPERFLREIRLAARLNHPHILPLFDSGEADGLLYYAMPYIQGESLRNRMDRAGPLSLEETTVIVRAIAAALDYAHRHDLVHRDIKPENVLLHEGEAMVTDFGIAKPLRVDEGDTLTQAGLILGTPAYMSPEQACGQEKLDGRSDVYSLGCLAYEMLTARRPFSGPNPLAILAKHITEPPPLVRAVRPEAPVAVERAVARALAKSPADRFTTAGGFASALGSAAGENGAAVATKVTVPTALPRSVAVLPFLNLSADRENEYFSDGITEDIINVLGKIPGLRVASRASAFSFKGKERDTADVGRRLDTATILEGSVRRAGQKLRVAVELVQAADGRQLWSERYDRELEDVFAIQDEISRSIAEVLKIKLMGDVAAPLAPRQTDDLGAYTLYLKGRFLWNKRTPDAMQKSIAHFEEAITRDSRYAPAYVGQADAYSLLGWWSDLPPGVAFPQAQAAARAALAIDPELAEAHATLAFARLQYDWDWVGAERGFRRALELNPEYASAWQWYAQLASAQGHTEDALAQLRRARELDPLSLIISITSALVRYYGHQFDMAIAEAIGTLEMDPTFAVGHWNLGRSYVQVGMHDKAIASLERALALSPFRAIMTASLGHACAVAGDRPRAEGILAELRQQAETTYVSPLDLATIHLGLGQTDTALDLLEAARDERSSRLISVRVEPVFDSLHGEPRFDAVLRSVGLD